MLLPEGIDKTNLVNHGLCLKVLERPNNHTVSASHKGVAFAKRFTNRCGVSYSLPKCLSRGLFAQNRLLDVFNVFTNIANVYENNKRFTNVCLFNIINTSGKCLHRNGLLNVWRKRLWNTTIIKVSSFTVG